MTEEDKIKTGIIRCIRRYGGQDVTYDSMISILQEKIKDLKTRINSSMKEIEMINGTIDFLTKNEVK